MLNTEILAKKLGEFNGLNKGPHRGGNLRPEEIDAIVSLIVENEGEFFIPEQKPAGNPSKYWIGIDPEDNSIWTEGKKDDLIAAWAKENEIDPKKIRSVKINAGRYGVEVTRGFGDIKVMWICSSDQLDATYSPEDAARIREALAA